MLTQYAGAQLRDQALLENARIDLTRYSTLVARHAIPEQTYATQQALVKQDEGNVKSDQGQIDSAKLNLVYCRITAPIPGASACAWWIPEISFPRIPPSWP